MADGMTIGQLAKAAGVSVETIRFYQRLGVIGAPQKPLGGQRRYSDSTVQQLAFVRRGQQLGFTLAEIKELLRLAVTSGRQEIQKLAQLRHSRLVLQLKELTARSENLARLLRRSRRYEGDGVDPIIAALQGIGRKPS